MLMDCLSKCEFVMDCLMCKTYEFSVEREGLPNLMNINFNLLTNQLLEATSN